MRTHPPDPMPPMDAAPDAVRNQLRDTPECPFTIEFTTEVLTEIRQSALEAFRSLPYGGLEIGGVLFGRVSPNGRSPRKVEVLADRAMECDHAAGPAFILSSSERIKLTQLFERARMEPDLAALSVVGFWVSHGRSELGLTSHDADLYRAFFPHPWQIALMLKPENARPMREAVFCRVDAKVVPYKRPSEIIAQPVPAPRPEKVIPEKVIKVLADFQPEKPILEAQPDPAVLDHVLPETPAPEPPRFATDIYLPVPPVEPPSDGVSAAAANTWAKDLYRPVGRSRALIQTLPVTNPEPPKPRTNPAAEPPRPRSYWETEIAAVEDEPVEVFTQASGLSYSSGWTAPEYPSELEELPPEPPYLEAAVEEVVESKPRDVDANIPPSFDLRAKPAPFQTLSQGSTSLGDLRTVPQLGQPSRPAPKVAAPPAPVDSTSLPDPAQIGDELSRLLISLRAAAADARAPRDSGHDADASGHFYQLANQSFGLKMMIVMLLVGTLLGGALAFLFFGNHQPVAAKAPGPDLGLEMFNTGKEVLIHWNAKSPLVIKARAAELRIHDSGMVQTLLVDLSALSKGYYRYRPTSSDVQTTLIVTENDGHNEQSIASRFAE